MFVLDVLRLKLPLSVSLYTMKLLEILLDK
nr:MAG TPA: hypothetical protein [Caudoviricetes sp.]